MIGRVHEFFRRHWHQALQIRQKIRFSEEAFHLVLAGGVGVIGGLVNLLFYHSIEWVKHLFLRRPGDPVEVAEMMEKLGWLGNVGLVLIPTFILATFLFFRS